MFRGEARWREIAELKEALSIPVIGNGDVRRAEDAVRMLRQTGCDAVMVGRGATRNPWVFRQIADRLADRLAGEEPGLDDRRRLILDHFRTVIARDDEKLAMHKLRTFTGWYSHGLPDGLSLRRRIESLPTPGSFLVAIEDFFADLRIARAA